MEFTLSSKLFNRKTSELRRVGINAQVLAAQSEDAGAVLGVLVREIGTLTNNTGRVLEEIGSGGERLAKNSLEATRIAQLLQKYDKALSLGVHGETETKVLAVFDSKNVEMREHLGQIQNELRDHKTKLEELQGAITFIPALIRLININVAKYDEFKGQFSTITTELDDFKIVILESTGSMIAGITASIDLVDAMFQETIDD